MSFSPAVSSILEALGVSICRLYLEPTYVLSLLIIWSFHPVSNQGFQPSGNAASVLGDSMAFAVKAGYAVRGRRSANDSDVVVPAVAKIVAAGQSMA